MKVSLSLGYLIDTLHFSFVPSKALLEYFTHLQEVRPDAISSGGKDYLHKISFGHFGNIFLHNRHGNHLGAKFEKDGNHTLLNREFFNQVRSFIHGFDIRLLRVDVAYDFLGYLDESEVKHIFEKYYDSKKFTSYKTAGGIWSGISKYGESSFRLYDKYLDCNVKNKRFLYPEIENDINLFQRCWRLEFQLRSSVLRQYIRTCSFEHYSIFKKAIGIVSNSFSDLVDLFQMNDFNENKIKKSVIKFKYPMCKGAFSYMKGNDFVDRLIQSNVKRSQRVLEKLGKFFLANGYDISDKITSGYRTATYQQEMRENGYKPSSKSFHLLALAFDIAKTVEITAIIYAPELKRLLDNEGWHFVKSDNCYHFEPFGIFE